MENIQQQILSEIKTLMASVRVQLEQLDAKMAQLQQMYEPQEYEAEPIEMDFDVFSEESVDDLPFHEDVPAVSVTEMISEQVCEVAGSVEDSVDAPVENPVEVVRQPEPEASIEDTVFMQEPEQGRPEPVPAAPVAVIDVMATKHAWRSDMPGTVVKDVRAAIALVDRALFINALFSGDAMEFMDTLNHINQADTLDDIVTYLAQTHPQWDFDSDVVYRFMMAVRRKINR